MRNGISILRALIVAILSLQLASCGTLLYPERRGHKVGSLDAGVVILDALGLLFGLIPGIIAFAVDFGTGCIYLPASQSSRLQGGKYRIVKFDPAHSSKESVEALISRETGREFHFNDPKIKYKEIKNQDDLSMQFSQFEEAKAQ